LARLGLRLKKTLRAAGQARADVAAAPRGQRVIGGVPYGHWRTSTFLAGLRHDRIVAPLVLDGAINGESFRA